MACAIAGLELGRIAEAERGFSAGHFLQGAEAAFRLIVAAFAAGDREKLRPLLSEAIFRDFEAAIVAREAAGEVQRSEIREVEQAVLTEAGLGEARPGEARPGERLASLTVRFVSMQVSVVTARDGTVASGVDGLTELVDLWTFERVLGTPGLAWKLARAVSG